MAAAPSSAPQVQSGGPRAQLLLGVWGLPRRTHLSCVGSRLFTTEPPGKPPSPVSRTPFCIPCRPQAAAPAVRRPLLFLCPLACVCSSWTVTRSESLPLPRGGQPPHLDAQSTLHLTPAPLPAWSPRSVISASLTGAAGVGLVSPCSRSTRPRCRESSWGPSCVETLAGWRGRLLISQWSEPVLLECFTTTAPMMSADRQGTAGTDPAAFTHGLQHSEKFREQICVRTLNHPALASSLPPSCKLWHLVFCFLFFFLKIIWNSHNCS